MFDSMMLASNCREQVYQHKYQKIKQNHCERKVDSKSSNGYRYNDPTVATFVDLNYPYVGQKSYRRRSRKVQSTRDLCLNNGYNHKTFDAQRRWSRDNIAETMEHFQPMASPSHQFKCSSYPTPPDYDYSCAYYELEVLSKIPTFEERPSQLSYLPSMRALLAETNEKFKISSPMNCGRDRHTYTTHYGTHENIYEEVSIQKPFEKASSAQSLVEQDCTKTEFQYILNSHYRVLEELNLSVEELLLSTSQSNVSSSKKITKRTLQPSLITEMFSLKISDKRRSSVNRLVGGDDSGFSDSSSGASYIASLKNYKSAITRSLQRSSRKDSAGCRSNTLPKNSAHDRFYTTNRIDNRNEDGDRKCLKFPFWNSR